MRIGMRITHWVVPLALLASAACEKKEEGETVKTDSTSAAATQAPAGGATTPAPGTPGAAPAAPAPGATAAATGTPPAGATAEMVQQGQQIFTTSGNCFTCHGPNAQGTALAPNLTDNQWLWFQGTPKLDDVVTRIKEGVPQPKQAPAPMPPMGGAQLTDDQVKAVAAYVLSLSQHG